MKVPILSECLPELRYLATLKGKRLSRYIHSATPRLINCLQQLALNILYSHKNGLNIEKRKLKKIKKHKKNLVKLINSPDTAAQKRILKKGGVISGILEILLNSCHYSLRPEYLSNLHRLL